MKDAIGYLRISTREQGRSGFGLAAQRCDIEAFGAREGFSIKSWYQDVQTGAGKDALLLRPGIDLYREARDSFYAVLNWSCATVLLLVFHGLYHGSSSLFN